MQVRLPDDTLISIEPSVPAYDPDGRQVSQFNGQTALWTWLRVDDRPWVLMARADFAALLIDVAKEVSNIDEYEEYLIDHWHEDSCDRGMILNPPPELPYGIYA